MSEAEAAIYLQLHVRTLQRYRKKGTLPYREEAGKTRAIIAYDKADLDRLKAELEARRTTTTRLQGKAKVARQRVTFGLTSAAYAELENEAKQFGMGVGEYARRLTREGLESSFHSEAKELRNRVKQLEVELNQTRKDFTAAFESVLEYAGLEPEEAKKWVTENLR